MRFDQFVCPACGGALEDTGNALRCVNGHCFDKARQGYVHLLPVQKKNSLLPGDDKEMVNARRNFLDTGLYAPFKDVLCGIVQDTVAGKAAPLVVDAGCGEGYYTGGVWQALKETCEAPKLCAFDISKFAVKAAAGRYKEIDFAVASSYAVPLAEACADVIVNVFSPMAASEFARILKPGGVLVFAVPSPRHLWGLKQVLYDEPYENEEKDVEYPGFVLEDRVPVRATIHVQGEKIGDLFAMTPYAWKTGMPGKQRLAEMDTLSTEIGFDFLIYKRV